MHLDEAEKLGEGVSVKQSDVPARHTSTHKDVVIVGCLVRLEEDVVTGKTQHLVVVATLGEGDRERPWWC